MFVAFTPKKVNKKLMHIYIYEKSTVLVYFVCKMIYSVHFKVYKNVYYCTYF